MTAKKSIFHKLFKRKPGPLEYNHICQRCGQKYKIRKGKNICPKCKTPYHLNLL